MNHVRFHGHMRPQRRRIGNPYTRKPSRRIDWLAVVLLCAASLVGLTLVYSKVLAP